jgi:hypothetical protein
MDREYDIFEIVSGAPIWHAHALGLAEARTKLLALSKLTANDCLAIHLPTREVALVLRAGAIQEGPAVLSELLPDNTSLG